MIHLVVGNLPPAITISQLTSFFSAFGDVQSVRRGKNHLTGRAEPFCFLDLREPGDSSRLGSANLRGHALTVRDALSPSGWAVGQY
jgi:hypothetical protein